MKQTSKQQELFSETSNIFAINPRTHSRPEEETNKSLDRFLKLRKKFKHLHMSDKDLEILMESQEDLNIYDEFHKDIYTREKNRHTALINNERTHKRKWNQSQHGLNDFKLKVMNELMKPLYDYKDSTLKSFIQSAEMCKYMVNKFNNNLSALGLDIEVPKTNVSKKQDISTEIIMNRMKENLKRKMQSKKDKEKRDRKKMREQIEMMNSLKSDNNVSQSENKRYGEHTTQSLPVEINDKYIVKYLEKQEEERKAKEQNENEKVNEGEVALNEETKVNVNEESKHNNEDNVNEIHIEEATPMNLINEVYRIHRGNKKVGDRINFFKTHIPEVIEQRKETEANNEHEPTQNIPQTQPQPSEDEYYSPSNFNKELFFKQLDKEDLEYNLKQTQLKQTKHTKHYNFLLPIITSLLDITNEVSSYQQETNVDLININKWNIWTSRFIDDLPIKDPNDIHQETTANITDDAVYESINTITTEMDEAQQNEMFDYANYIGKWKHSLIPVKTKGISLKYESLYGDIYKPGENGNVDINDYEPTSDELVNLYLPKERIMNYNFADIIENALDNKYTNDSTLTTINDDIKPHTHDIKFGKYCYLPIKLSLIGYPLSGKKTQAKAISQRYPNIKVYDVYELLQNYITQYEQLQQPIESDPKYKTFKPKQIEQWNEEHEKKLEEFKPIQAILQPYLNVMNSTSDNNNTHILDKTYCELLCMQLNKDFPEEQRESFVNDLKCKYDIKMEQIEKIETFKEEEATTKKSRSKEIQTCQKEIDKVMNDLNVGFVLINFPSTLKQSTLLEYHLTGYVSENELPKTQKEIDLYSYNNIIDISQRLPNENTLTQAGVDVVLNLQLSQNELERRFNGIRYDPVTNTTYHLDDDPPNTSDKKLMERLDMHLPGLNEEEFKQKRYEYDSNICLMRSFYKHLGDVANGTKVMRDAVIADNMKCNDVSEMICKEVIEGVINGFYVNTIEKVIAYYGKLAEEKERERKEREDKESQNNNNNNNNVELQEQGNEAVQSEINVEDSSKKENDSSQQQQQTSQQNEDNDVHVNNSHLRGDSSSQLNSSPISRHETSTFRSRHSKISPTILLHGFQEHNYENINLNWSQFTSYYLTTLNRFFIFLSKQRLHIISTLTQIQNTFISFLRRQTYKKQLVTNYINKYNDLSVTYPHLRNSPKLVNEFKSNISELNQNMWTLIQEKKTGDITKLQELRTESNLNFEIDSFYSFIISVFIAETKKYLTSIDVIKEYYMKDNNTNTSSDPNVLEFVDTSTIIPDSSVETFHAKINAVFTNCLKLIIQQDMHIKAYEKRYKLINNSLHHQNSSNSNIPFVTKSSKTYIDSPHSTRKQRHRKHEHNNNIINNEVNFYEEEIKLQIKNEKSKYKYRLMLLKYFALSQYDVITKAYTDTYALMDEWIIDSVKHQNDVLNNFIYYLNRAIINNTSSLSLYDFEFDAFDIYDTKNIAVALNGDVDDVKQDVVVMSRENYQEVFAYSVFELYEVYLKVKKHATYVSYLVKEDIVYEVLVKRFFTGRCENDGVCAFVKKMNGKEFKKFVDGFIEEVERVNVDANVNEVKYWEYVNIKEMFTVLMLLGSVTVSDEKIKEMVSKCNVVRSTKVKKEEFLKMKFWFEEDGYLEVVKGDKEKGMLEQKNITKINAVKEVLFLINKDEDDDVVDIVKFMEVFKRMKKGFGIRRMKKERKKEEEEEVNVEEKGNEEEEEKEKVNKEEEEQQQKEEEGNDDNEQVKNDDNDNKEEDNEMKQNNESLLHIKDNDNVNEEQDEDDDIISKTNGNNINLSNKPIYSIVF